MVHSAASARLGLGKKKREEIERWMTPNRRCHTYVCSRRPIPTSVRNNFWNFSRQWSASVISNIEPQIPAKGPRGCHKQVSVPLGPLPILCLSNYLAVYKFQKFSKSTEQLKGSDIDQIPEPLGLNNEGISTWTQGLSWWSFVECTKKVSIISSVLVTECR